MQNREKKLEYMRNYVHRVYHDNPKKWLEANKKYVNSELGKATREKRLGIKKEIITKYKSEHGCIICGEKDPVVLEFHHLDPKTKKLGGLAHMRDCSIETIKNEMDKCVILCANDHRRVTVGKIELPARSK